MLGTTTSNPNLSSIPGYPTSLGRAPIGPSTTRRTATRSILTPRTPGLAPQAGGGPQWLVLTGLGYTSFFQITQAADSNPGRYTLTAKTTQLTLALGADSCRRHFI